MNTSTTNDSRLTTRGGYDMTTSPEILKRLFFCAEHELAEECRARTVTHVVSIGWPPPEDPTEVRARARALFQPLARMRERTVLTTRPMHQTLTAPRAVDNTSHRDTSMTPTPWSSPSKTPSSQTFSARCPKPPRSFAKRSRRARRTSSACIATPARRALPPSLPRI